MSNHLARQTSPYLLQHAENPVDWYPWGEEALALARQLDRPILLSIGYSACHWCHVMARECFEDAEVAAVMNRYFVNIKVDREERPDIDQIYQTAHQLLSDRSGGWPLTVFLTPDQTPFFSGTYFPPTPRHQLPGFPDLARHIAEFYRTRKHELTRQNDKLRHALSRFKPSPAAQVRADEQTLTRALLQLAANFDFHHGGTAMAPKFPNHAEIAFLLRRAAAGDEKAHTMALKTLHGMAAGGLFDQLGGGFARYSVDERWEIPHFEKMLYDNGQLLALYADGWQLLADKESAQAQRFVSVIEETVGWLQRELLAPSGAFYAALDADSPDADGEREEGLFYLWQQDEAQQLLGAEEYAAAARCLGLDQPPNFEGRAWHLRLAAPPREEEAAPLARARQKLLAARGKRSPPLRDDKILTGWNALAIQGLARAGRALARPEWVACARRALDFIRTACWIDGRLLAVPPGATPLPAYLDDYAFLLDALLELLQADYRPQDMDFAVALADVLLAEFAADDSGFYFTSHHHETLIHRPRSCYDNATPSGNGIAAAALQRLGHLLGEPRYLAAAEHTLRAFDGALQQSPAACPSLLLALAEFLTPPTLLVLRGTRARMASWLQPLQQHYRPHLLSFALDETANGLPAMLDRPCPLDEVNAWVCHGVQCLPVIRQPDALLECL